MSKYFKICCVIIIMTFISCSCGKKKTSRNQLIPSKDLVSILTDLYLADGLLTYPPLRQQFSTRDSLSNYIDIIEKHGYTKARMDATIRYYFLKKPNKLEKIYDDVLGRLSEIQSRLKTKLSLGPVNTSNLWTEQLNYSLPEGGANSYIFFNIPLKDTGLYELSLRVMVFKEDQSLNPRINVFFWHADNTKTGARDNWNVVNLPKDGKWHNYNLLKRLTDTAFRHFSGWLMYHDPKPGLWNKHAKVENITLLKVSRK
jgi:hypothetical protein